MPQAMLFDMMEYSREESLMAYLTSMLFAMYWIYLSTLKMLLNSYAINHGNCDILG